jgi:hypothetical protein
VKELDLALQARDFAGAARINAPLAQEALISAYRTLKAWENLRNSATALLPRSIDPDNRYWNAADVGADLFPYLFYAAFLLDSKNLAPWLDTLAAERRLCGRMPFFPCREPEMASFTACTMPKPEKCSTT